MHMRTGTDAERKKEGAVFYLIEYLADQFQMPRGIFNEHNAVTLLCY